MHNCRLTRLRHIIMGVLALLFTSQLSPVRSQPAGDETIGSRAAEFGFTKNDLAKVDRGGVCTVNLVSSDEREVSIIGLVRLKEGRTALAELFGNLERLALAEDVARIERLSNPPRVSDFAALVVEDEDIAALRKCRSGDCLLKLSAAMMDTLGNQVLWSSPGAREHAIARYKSILANYAGAYDQQGDSALITYADGATPQNLARNHTLLLNRAPSLLRDLPTIQQQLKDGSPSEPEAESFLYWSRRKFGPKWVTTINHARLLFSHSEDPRPVLVLKQIYANHFFQGGLQVYRVFYDSAMPSTSDSYLMLESRIMIDPPRGPLAGVQRSKIRTLAQSALAARLKVIRDGNETGK